MIYQLVQRLRDRLPEIPIVAEFLDPGDKQNCVLVQTSGGTAAGYPSRRVDQTFAIYVMHKNGAMAKEWADALFEEVFESHWQTYEAVRLATGASSPMTNDVLVVRIYSQNPPYWTGRDEQGRGVYYLSATAIYSL